MEELHDTTSAFTPQSAKDAGIKVLDICMAPGGFSAAIFKEHQDAKISAITLPKSQNGHDILLPDWKNDRRLEFYFADRRKQKCPVMGCVPARNLGIDVRLCCLDMFSSPPSIPQLHAVANKQGGNYQRRVNRQH